VNFLFSTFPILSNGISLIEQNCNMSAILVVRKEDFMSAGLLNALSRSLFFVISLVVIIVGQPEYSQVVVKC